MPITLYPGTPIPTTRSWLHRRLSDGRLAWAAWRQRRQQRRAMKALEGLSDATLKDIGLAEMAADRQRSVAAAQFRRGL